MEVGWSSPGTAYISEKVANASGATTQSTAAAGNPQGLPPGTPTNAQGNYNGANGVPSNNAANESWHYSGTANQYVDNSYTKDANGKVMGDEERTRWIQADKDRAYRNSLIASHNASLGKAATGGPGVDAPIYDADTKTYSYKDKNGAWTHGVGVNDIYAKLNSDVQKNYPEWYFGQYARTQDDAHRSAWDAAAFDNQTFATRGTQTTKYAATNF